MKYLLSIILLLSFFGLNSQVKDLSKEKDIFYQDEITGGLQIKTNGWGLDFRRGYYKNPKLKNYWEVGLYNTKHPKEQKRATYYSITERYVYGKLNKVYNINAGYGKQFLIFEKKEIGTVDIRIISSAGINLAFLKPIYYEIILNSDLETVIEKYKPSHQPGLIAGKAPFYKGLNEIKINPGVYFKLGTSFEHSRNVKSIRSFELGIKSTLYLKKLQIMAEIDNPQIIVSLFISYRIGLLRENKQKKEKF